MQFKNKKFQRFWRFSTSFQLGVPVMVFLTLLIIWGTLVESRYDAWTAQKLVYQSWMMYLVMGLLIYNLTIVMVDRLPWKKHHYSFILVHVGIIVLILGGWVTQKFGVDGQLVIPVLKSNQEIMIPNTGLTVYTTFDGNNYRIVHDLEVDFYNQKVSKSKPVDLYLNNKHLKVIDYSPYVRANQKIMTAEAADVSAGASIKFQLSNQNISQIETLTQQNKNKVAETKLGLLNIYLGYNYKTLGRKQPSSNELYLNPLGENDLEIALFNKEESRPYKVVKAQIGSVVSTTWMGLEVRILDFIPRARMHWTVQPQERPNALTTSAILVEFDQKEEWILLNDILKIFTDTEAYLVSYNNRRIKLDFSLFLKEFKVTKYQGTNKAMEYSSLVEIHDKSETGNLMPIESLISMNEPLKYKGYTFYQASYETDEKTGEPVATVLSVNRDPGRWIKYLGSLILSIGIVWIFYQRRKKRTAA